MRFTLAFPYDMSGPSPLTKMNMTGPGTGQSSAGIPPLDSGVPNIMGILQQMLGPPQLQAGMQPQMSTAESTRTNEENLLRAILEAMSMGRLSSTTD